MSDFERKTTCPFCGTEHMLVGAMIDTEVQPEDGDISLCIKCGEWMIIETSELGARVPSSSEYEIIATNDMATTVRAAWLEVDRKRKNANP